MFAPPFGCGTTFTIWLPIGGEATVPAAEIASDVPRGRGQSVMAHEYTRSELCSANSRPSCATREARIAKNNGSTFQMTTIPTPGQHRALQLLQSIDV
jgi:hypothetical protein